MRRIPFALACAVIVLIPFNAYAGTISASELIDFTNYARREADLPPLSPNNRLTQAAYNKAQDILTNGYFAHTNPEGKPFYKWIEEQGYDYVYAGENLAIDFFTSEGAIDAWLASTTHRANILNEHYTEIGLAALQGPWKDRETIVAVQMFGSAPKEEPTVLGSTFETLTRELNVNTESVADLVTDLVLLPSSAGRKYLDALLNPSSETKPQEQTPSEQMYEGRIIREDSSIQAITKIAQARPYYSLLEKRTNCCKNETIFALSEYTALPQKLSSNYPSLDALISGITAPQHRVSIAPSDLALDIMLASVVVILLLIAYRKDIALLMHRENA